MEASWVAGGASAADDATGAAGTPEAATELQVLDVRREPEWQAGHIAEAAWFPLDQFKVSAPEVDPSKPLAVHCQGGYRSMIACSLLRRAGVENVINVSGGFDAWRNAGLPVETAVAEKV